MRRRGARRRNCPGTAACRAIGRTAARAPVAVRGSLTALDLRRRAEGRTRWCEIERPLIGVLAQSQEHFFAWRQRHDDHPDAALWVLGGLLFAVATRARTAARTLRVRVACSDGCSRTRSFARGRCSTRRALRIDGGIGRDVSPERALGSAHFSLLGTSARPLAAPFAYRRPGRMHGGFTRFFATKTLLVKMRLEERTEKYERPIEQDSARIVRVVYPIRRFGSPTDVPIAGAPHHPRWRFFDARDPARAAPIVLHPIPVVHRDVAPGFRVIAHPVRRIGRGRRHVFGGGCVFCAPLPVAPRLIGGEVRLDVTGTPPHAESRVRVPIAVSFERRLVSRVARRNFRVDIRPLGCHRELGCSRLLWTRRAPDGKTEQKSGDSQLLARVRSHESDHRTYGAIDDGDVAFVPKRQH